MHPITGLARELFLDPVPPARMTEGSPEVIIRPVRMYPKLITGAIMTENISVTCLFRDDLGCYHCGPRLSPISHKAKKTLFASSLGSISHLTNMFHCHDTGIV